MWSMKLIILLLFCYGCLSTNNGKVYFVSRNFYNILHWAPAEPVVPGENVDYLYSVQYKSDAEGQSFEIKKGCQSTKALSCDLTAETPSIHDVHYYAEVLVNGTCYGRTNRFKPIAETILGAPTLSLHTTVSSLHVNVTLPLGPNGVSIADIINKSKNGPSKPVAVYILKITHPKWAAQDKENTVGQFVINLKNNRTEYCGYVVYKPESEWGRSGSENASFCITLPGDPLMILPWHLISAALLVALVIASVVCTCNYVRGGKEKSMPQGLVPFQPSNTTPRILLSPDENRIISKLEICTQSDQTVYAKIRVPPNVASLRSDGYSPQDIPWPGSSGSSVDTGTQSPSPNPEATSAQSSEMYSLVAVHIPAEEKDFQQSAIKARENRNSPLSSGGENWNKGGISPKLTTLPVQDPCNSDQYKPLLVHAVRDANGQLVLPLFAGHFGSSTDNAERKPLLSDLIVSMPDGPSLASLQSSDGSEWSDSGCDDSTMNTPTQAYCNTNYCPSQPVVSYFQQGCQTIQSSNAIFDSGYKQNWMPATLGDISKDSCEYRRTNYPCTWTAPTMKEEGEVEEDRGGEDRIFLGHWAVQIQE
ncbi:interferon lambda receptor 1 isoform X1 [Larimichthys crocea]|uniref:interferon lambda receptor 1 isoform X1 n=1 Tax=Larimichthys crocea TaxID=215358 RepID=UPI000F5D8E6C|nr:uncharacterized protein LOC104924714 isoform X1 [Larimichthys crocea]